MEIYIQNTHTKLPRSLSSAFSLCVPVGSVAQSRPTLCYPVDCSLPGSSVQGILQARILEWVAISFSRASSRPGSPALEADALNHQGVCNFLQILTVVVASRKLPAFYLFSSLRVVPTTLLTMDIKPLVICYPGNS